MMQRPPTGLAELPRISRETVRRDRLLRKLASRFERPLTFVTGGAGFGKTTLLVQAALENQLDPRGVDVWFSGRTIDEDPAHLLGGLLAAIAGRAAPHGTLDALLAALWARSPTDVAILLDDAHRIDPASRGWQALARLVDEMPGNAHLVIASRSRTPLRLASDLAATDWLDIDEAQLAFDEADLAAFARLRGVRADRLGGSGWPAVVELAAASPPGERHDLDFIREEVLDQLGPERLAALNRLVSAPWIDDELVHAVTDYAGDAAALTSDLPLTTRTDSGRVRFHDLWREHLLPTQPEAALRDARIAIGREFFDRGQLIEAVELFAEADAWEDAERVLRAFARDLGFAHPVRDRVRAASLLPSDVALRPPARLLTADALFAREPARAAPFLETALAAARDAGDAEVEVFAKLRLAEIAYRTSDMEGLANHKDDLDALVDRDAPHARSARALVRSWHGETTGIVPTPAKAEDAPPGGEDLLFQEDLDFYRRVTRATAGWAAELLDDEGLDLARPSNRFRQRMGGLLSILQWWCGRLDGDAREAVVALLDHIEQAGQTELLVDGCATTALYFASAGQVERARSLHDRAAALADRLPAGAWGRRGMQGIGAVLDLFRGDEAAAAARLEATVPHEGALYGMANHVLGNVIGLVYLYVPRARAGLDVAGLGPELQLGIDVARALLALREAGDPEPAAALPWDALSTLRTWAYEPHLAELATAALVAGVGAAEAALDSLEHDPHTALARVAERYGGEIGRHARRSLASTPNRPGETLHISVLGALEVRLGDDSLLGTPGLRRRMVRELLMHLVHEREAERQAIAARMWPEKEPRSALQNLRVNLSYLRDAIEPDRREGSSSWHLRADAERLELFPSDRLEVDVETFEAHFESGRRADRNGVPDLALDHYRAACALYRGEYLIDMIDLESAADERTRLTRNFLESAIRASELMAAQREWEEAAALATRAIETDAFEERAHRALARAFALAGERAAAIRSLRLAIDGLREEDLDPEPETLELLARLEQTPAEEASA